MSLRRKLQTLLAALVSVVLGLAAVTLWATFQWQQSENELREHYLRSLLLQEVRAGTFRAFKELPDAIFSGDLDARVEFDTLLGEAEKDFISWADLAHNDTEDRQVREVRASYDDLIRHARQFFDYVAAGQGGEAARILEEQIDSKDFELFERLSASAVQSDRDYRRHVQRKSARIREIAQLALGTAAALAIGLVAFLGFYFISGLFRPLREVENALSALGRGDLQRRIPDMAVLPVSIRAEDELNTLVQAFNRTVEELGRTTVSKAYLDSIIESLVDALVVTAQDGTIRTANPAAGALFGARREELVGRPIADFIDHADVDGAERVRYRETVARGGAGVEVPVGFSRSVMRDLDGVILGFACVAQDISERRRAEEQIRAALEEKEVLFKEINHRVKNNLQVIDSLLSLHTRQLADPEAIRILQESRNRIQAMALVHEMLYRSGTPSRINLGDYLQSLTQHLMNSHGTGPGCIQLVSRIAPVSLGLDAAVPCGLIINELVTNSLKHAFPDGARGEITIELQESPDRHFTLIVRDNGVGLPANLHIAETRTLGLRLVRTLVEQLGGTLAAKDGGGASFQVRFPVHSGA